MYCFLTLYYLKNKTSLIRESDPQLLCPDLSPIKLMETSQFILRSICLHGKTIWITSGFVVMFVLQNCFLILHSFSKERCHLAWAQTSRAVGGGKRLSPLGRCWVLVPGQGTLLWLHASLRPHCNGIHSYDILPQFSPSLSPEHLTLPQLFCHLYQEWYLDTSSGWCGILAVLPWEGQVGILQSFPWYDSRGRPFHSNFTVTRLEDDH